MIVGFLEWFQTDIVHPVWHPQRLIGYISTIGLFAGIIYFTINRIKKLKENGKYSHYTDWTFLILLFLTTLSGILLHYFRVSGLPVATYITYLIHLMVLVPMLMIEVPFSKWSHLAYRPFAIYFANLKKSVLNRSQNIQAVTI
jgi:nitrate reductase gamma subunit